MEEEQNSLESLNEGISRVMGHISSKLAYVSLAVGLLPSLEELATQGIVIAPSSTDKSKILDRFRDDLKNVREALEWIYSYNNLPVLDLIEQEPDDINQIIILHQKFIQRENQRENNLEFLVNLGKNLENNYKQMLTFSIFYNIRKAQGDKFDYSQYGRNVTGGLRRKMMSALRKEEIEMLKFFRGAFDEDSPVYKTLGKDVSIDEFRNEVRALAPEVNEPSVIRLDAFKGDYLLKKLIGIKTFDGKRLYIVQVENVAMNRLGQELNLYAAGDKIPVIKLPHRPFVETTLIQKELYEMELSRIASIRERDKL